jgi:hypothetical protein
MRASPGTSPRRGDNPIFLAHTPRNFATMGAPQGARGGDQLGRPLSAKQHLTSRCATYSHHPLRGYRGGTPHPLLVRPPEPPNLA